MLKLAYREWGWLDQAYGDKLQKRSPKNERHVYLNVQEIGELLAAIPENKTTEKKIIALAALTGLRRGELLALEPSNIQRGRILLRANQTKSGKARSVPVPVPGYALPWLEELPFQTTYSRLRVAFENACRNVG